MRRYRLARAQTLARLVELVAEQLVDDGVHGAHVGVTAKAGHATQVLLVDQGGRFELVDWGADADGLACVLTDDWTVSAFVTVWGKGLSAAEAAAACQTVMESVLTAAARVPLDIEVDGVTTTPAAGSGPDLDPDPDAHGWLAEARIDIACHGDIAPSMP